MLWCTDLVFCAWLCVGAQCGKLAVLSYFLLRVNFSSKGPNIENVKMVLGLPFPFENSLEKNLSPMPGKPPGHPVYM